MAVDAEMQVLIDAINNSGMPKIGDLPVAAMRVGLAPPPSTEEVWAIRDSIVPGPAGGIPVRIYQPRETTVGLIVFFHGGGWTVGDLDSHDGAVRLAANTTECTIVSVDYRLAPENPFPAAVDDAWAAVVWAGGQRCALTGRADAPLMLFGDSAGANLAAVVAILARDAGGPDIALQLLIYPSTEGDVDAECMKRFEPPLLDRDTIAWFYDQYIPREQRGDFRFAPGRAPDLSRLPPALLVTAEYDLLAEEGELYARKLKAAGNRVRHVEYEGGVHGFISMLPNGRLTRRTIDDVAREVAIVTR